MPCVFTNSFLCEAPTYNPYHMNFPGLVQSMSIVITCIFAGICIGALSNLINGSVSPYYFQAVMDWHFADIPRAALVQGIFEGLLNGAFLSIIFTAGFFLITKGKSTYMTAAKLIGQIVCITLLFWTLGGLIAMGLATLSPDFYQSMFPLTPSNPGEMLHFAWVGGSIWGAMIGSIIAITSTLVILKTNLQNADPA